MNKLALTDKTIQRAIASRFKAKGMSSRMARRQTQALFDIIKRQQQSPRKLVRTIDAATKNLSSKHYAIPKAQIPYAVASDLQKAVSAIKKGRKFAKPSVSNLRKGLAVGATGLALLGLYGLSKSKSQPQQIMGDQYSG